MTTTMQRTGDISRLPNTHIPVHFFLTCDQLSEIKPYLLRAICRHDSDNSTKGLKGLKVKNLSGTKCGRYEVEADTGTDISKLAG